MNELISFSFIDNSIKVIIDESILNVIPQDEFPLTFKVEEWLNNKLVWTCELYSGWWATYHDLNYKNFSIYTKNNKLLKESKYTPDRIIGNLEEYFYLWIKSRKKTNGLVLGAGTGEWGEWVYNTINDDCNVILVEGDPNNIKILKENYKNIKNAIIEPIVVSPNGGNVNFWVAPFGLVSSMDKNNVKKFLPDSEPECIEVKSKSVMEIIHDNIPTGFLDWIRIDLEGIDHDIIMNIDDDILEKTSMFIYENMNISDNQIMEINKKLIKNGFINIIKIGIDTIAIK